MLFTGGGTVVVNLGVSLHVAPLELGRVHVEDVVQRAADTLFLCPQIIQTLGAISTAHILSEVCYLLTMK